ncbi:MAG TPA: bifunctional glutamate N-acetyltransferase/amino-acid acetyltransferase ArgJ [Terriglobia bacterium]|nr:bifunctional glutamate N-acetyltransferase/amino-acid acetyltransferase ArgJ [Terriglobia bacterium]
MHKWEVVEGNLASARGFRGAAVAAGIKKRHGELDLALLVCDAPAATSAGLFTTNLAAAAPVLFSRQNLAESHGHCRALVVNSGSANACTGREGLHAAREIVRTAAKLLNLQPAQVLIASTGVIGVALEPGLVTSQLPALVERLSIENASAVAHAIMTTDTFPKSCVLRSEVGGKSVYLAGVAKGAGMIHPRVATMLSFLTTDALIGPRTLQNLLRAAVDVSFNRITVDGDTSTNDTVLAWASGLAAIGVRPGDTSWAWFLEGLTEVCQSLAKMIARDGEGAKKLIIVEVRGARRPSDADRVARAIANSPLVKTAIGGSDPNWGRILCAAGYSGALFDPSKVDIHINDLLVCREGVDAGFDEASARKELEGKEVILRLDLHQGSASVHIWTCDLTHDYITINASHRT